MGRKKVLLGIWFEPAMREKFVALCKKERRDYGAQFEIIFEDWLLKRGGATAQQRTEQSAGKQSKFITN